MTARRIYVPAAMPSRDANGRALPAKLRFYEPTGTYDLPKTVYANEALTTPHDFPVLSDSYGRFPEIWADVAQTFDVAYSDQTFDRTLAGPFGNVSPLTDATAASVALAESAADAAETAKLEAEVIAGDLAPLATSVADAGASASAAAASESSATASASSASASASSAGASAASASASESSAAQSAYDAAAQAGAAGSLVASAVVGAMGLGTRAAWQASSIPTAFRLSGITTTGHSVVGDGGKATWKYVASEPAHIGKFQSADGAWWEIASDVITLEALGYPGDYDPDTETGTDCTPAFDALAQIGKPLQLLPEHNYLITDEIIIFSGMDIRGDANYSAAIYPQFSTSGKKMVHSDLSTSAVVTNVSITGVTFARIGTHVEHGIVVDNLDGLKLDVKVIAEAGPTGGAVGVSCFQPECRPSTNVEVKGRIEYGGNFGVQFGNVSNGSMQVFSTQTHREAIGLEPYVLGAFDFATADVSSDTIHAVAHGMETGHPLIYSSQGNTAIASLPRSSYYFAIGVDADHFKVANTQKLAEAGTALALSSISGTHRLLKCGVLRNVTVLPSELDVGDVTASGTNTGVIIITASSAGYLENVTLSPPTIRERNTVGGSNGINILGVQNFTLNGADITGTQLAAVNVTRATLNGLRDSNGTTIDPSPSVFLLPNVTVRGITARDFVQHGVNVEYGTVSVEACDARSDRATGSAYRLTTTAEATASYVRRSTAYAPAGTAFSLKNAEGNVDLGSDTRRNKRGDKKVTTYAKKAIADVSTTAVAALSSSTSSNSTYSGILAILAKQADSDSSNSASYLLHVIKSSSGGSPSVATISSVGLTSGGSGNHPSFTWTVDSSGNLIATVVASTTAAPATPWYFFLEASGDLSLV